MTPQRQAALEQYHELGYDTLPLAPGTKRPCRRSWQTASPGRLWEKAPEDANIGIRGGGPAAVAVIDCDDKNHPGTFEAVTNYLAGLGLQPGSYPLIKTASGIGRHIYLTWTGALDGHSCQLAQDVGAGEFRYGPGAQVAAPPSVVDGGDYALLSGDYSHLPSLTLSDISTLINPQTITLASDNLKTIPRRAAAILRGELADNFPSRSEAEFSAMVSLVNAGFIFSEIAAIFDRTQNPSNYNDRRKANPAKASKWLYGEYARALKFSQNESPARRLITQALGYYAAIPWPGRTGAIDRLILTAHLQIAYKAGRLTYAAGCRDLADMAGVGNKTALRSTTRLDKRELVKLARPGVADCANIYTLPENSLKMDKVTHSLLTTVRKCVTLSKTSNHDAFRAYGLGKAAGEVWEILQETPATVAELAEQTGRHPRTVKRSITRMAKIVDTYTGELLPMVETKDGKTWQALPADLDRIALILGQAGQGRKQKERHAQERRKHNRIFKPITKKAAK